MDFINKMVMLITCLLWCFISTAQSVGIGTETPHEGAALDISSTDRGLLIPRVDTAMVTNPVEGLLVLLPGTKDIYKYSGSNWEELGEVAEIMEDNDKDSQILFEEGGSDFMRLKLSGVSKYLFKPQGVIDIQDTNGNIGLGGNVFLFLSSGTSNTAIGSNALFFNQTGNFNTALGTAALQSNSSGSQNTALGTGSLGANSIGVGNSALGWGSLDSNIDGGSNVGIGLSALNKMANGSFNTALGAHALSENTSGNYNVALGYQAGYQETGSNRLYIENTGSDKNNALIYGEFDNDFLRLNGEVHLRDGMVDASGSSKIYLSNDKIRMRLNTRDHFNIESEGIGRSRIEFLNNRENIAIGMDALENNSNGENNIALGNGALNVNFEGNLNVGIGNYALASNSTGSQNVGIGSAVLAYNTIGYNNIGIGAFALQSMIDGVDNIAIGSVAQTLNTIGSGNTIIGNFASAKNISGSNNVVVGKDAMSNNQGGSRNVMLGFLAGSNEMGSDKLYIENSTAGSTGALIYGEFNNDLIRLNGEVIIRDGIKGNTEINGNTEISGNVDVGSDATIDGFLAIGDFHQDRARLEVYDYGPLPIQITAAYYNAAGNSGVLSLSRSLGGWFEEHVAAREFQAFSDARIKNIKGITDSAEDLLTLSKIEVTDYKFIDSIGSGNQLHKKVIAQQVKEIYPQAVKADIKDFVPNVYQLTDIKDGWVSISIPVEIGDRIKLILKDGIMIANVIDSSEEGVKLDIDQKGQVFIYGTEVDNFHTVDYEALSMLNISATQELIAQIEALKADNNMLRVSLDTQSKKIDNIMKHLGLVNKTYIDSELLK